MKKINRAKVMNAIRVSSPLSRSEIAQLTSLDKKSITNFVSELEREGIIQEIGKRPSDTGRPFTLLSFKRDGQHALGLSIEPECVVGTLVNLYGEVSRTLRIDCEADSDLKTILKAVRDLYTQLRPRAEVAGVGIAIPGVADLQRGVMIDSVNIPAMKGVHILEELRRVIREPLFLEEASLAKTVAEKWFGSGRGARTFCLVDIGIGVGMGLMYDGRLYRGAVGFAGEIGHVMVEAGGRRCRCGNAGCLEAYLSERQILSQLSPHERRSFQQCSEIKVLHPDTQRVLSDAGYRLGLALSYLVNVMGPMPLVLNGELLRFHETLLPEIRRGLKTHTINAFTEKISISVSQLKDASALGAAACVLADIFEVPGHFYA